MEEKKITMEYMLLHVIGHWGSIIKVSIIGKKLFFFEKTKRTAVLCNN